VGWWFDMDGKKIRRIRADEYPLLYHLHRKQTAIRCGVTLLGQKPNYYTALTEGAGTPGARLDTRSAPSVSAATTLGQGPSY
jgi:hypothetical protein